MEATNLDPRLNLMQDADMKGKVVLVRVDHNVVKKGAIKDPYRIDATFGTLYGIVEKGGRPILMTHVGRPRDKKTGNIKCDDSTSVRPIVRYLENKLPIKIHVPEFPVDPEKGILHLDDSIYSQIERLKQGELGMIYLPNTRWFQGEQSKGPEREIFCEELARLADLFVNDAFGSWQPHASTYDIAKKLPSFAGVLMQREISHLNAVLNPQRPFVAVIAGAKYDTKIGPLRALYERVDKLILGGLLYNTFLAAKYGIKIKGVAEEDMALAKDLVELDEKEHKLVELPYLVESDQIEKRQSGGWRSISLKEFEQGKEYNYFVDIDPRSFEQSEASDVIGSAKTIFVNAVMGLMPLFWEGSKAFYELVFSNSSASKLFGGGDTLQELKNLVPGHYMEGLDAENTYFFTGGGSVLTAIEGGGPYGIKPVEALLKN